MMAQSKPRRTKTPIASVRDKFEEVHKASQSEMSPTYIEIPHIEIPVEPTIIVESIPEPMPEVKSKKSNAWIIHVKSIAEGKGIKFRDALRDPETKATYKK
jgi:hypothetical protein